MPVAKVTLDGKAFTMEDVRFTYNPEENAVRLVITDDAFPDGVNIPLAPGSDLESLTRAVFGLSPREQYRKESLTQRRSLHLVSYEGPPKAIVVAPRNVAEVLEGLRTEWDFLPSILSLEALHTGLQDGTIPEDLRYVLVVDKRVEQENFSECAETVSKLSSNYFVGILSYSYPLKTRIRSAVKQVSPDPSRVQYYFIDPEKPNRSLMAAVADYETQARRA